MTTSNAVKAARVTLKSALISGDVNGLSRLILANAESIHAGKVAEMNVAHAAAVKAAGEDLEAVAAADAALAKGLKDLGDVKGQTKVLGQTFASAVKEIPNIIKLMEEEAEAAQLMAQAAAEAEKKAKEEEEAAALKALEERKQKLIVAIMATGTDESGATFAAEALIKAEIAKQSGSKNGGKVKERATIVVDGKEYQVPTAGNMNSELKELFKASGIATRADWIAKFAKVQEKEEQPAE
jgi:hypothetical protein